MKVLTENNAENSLFIEDASLFFEKINLPRMAGRILGALLIADPPIQSIHELCEKLSVSKSSVSIMTRLLIKNGLIEAAPGPLPRRDYYRFKPGGWSLYLRQWMAVMNGLDLISKRGLVLMEGKPPETTERLQEAHRMVTVLEKRFLPLIAELENGPTPGGPPLAP